MNIKLFTLVSLCVTQFAFAQTPPQIAGVFISAVEKSGFAGAVAYEFILSCNKPNCELSRITYEICSPDKSLNRDVMSTYHHEYSTANKDLLVNYQEGKQSIGTMTVKFGTVDLVSYGGQTTLKFDIKPGLPSIPEIGNFSGFIEKISIVTGLRSVVALSPVLQPGAALKRNCPVMLQSSLKR